MGSTRSQTETEKAMTRVLGKTFKYYDGGKLVATGIVLGLTSVNAINLEYTFEADAGVPEGDLFEIRPVSELKYDYRTKTGFWFSKDNPHRESLEG